MIHTYFQLIYHFVWSTKNRHAYIASSFEERLHSYLAGSFKIKDCLPIQIGGMSDHIHALIAVPPTIAIAEVIRNVKVSATKWVHQTISESEDFAWQEGYGAFSVSSSNCELVRNYIRNQKEHHKEMNFRDEFLALLNKHEVIFDEKYLWK